MKLSFNFSLLLSLGLATTFFDSADPRYACTQSSDCAIKNHGNCCGYYPVCARSDAVFTEEEACPSEGIGLCGFPVITACKCEEGACVAVELTLEDLEDLEGQEQWGYGGEYRV